MKPTKETLEAAKRFAAKLDLDIVEFEKEYKGCLAYQPCDKRR